jgi:hypothetical protein
MKQKRLTKEQLEKYENKKLTSKEIIQMEERGFKIPLILKLNALQEDKISFTEDTVRDMLEFAVEREYYEKAALLHTYLESNTSSN